MLGNFSCIVVSTSGLQIRVRIGKLFSLFLIQNISCEYSKDGSFEHPKHMFKLMGKKILQFYAHKISLSGPMQLIKKLFQNTIRVSSCLDSDQD